MRYGHKILDPRALKSWNVFVSLVRFPQSVRVRDINEIIKYLLKIDRARHTR